jgi:hypothetical protein
MSIPLLLSTQSIIIIIGNLIPGRPPNGTACQSVVTIHENTTMRRHRPSMAESRGQKKANKNGASRK